MLTPLRKLGVILAMVSAPVAGCASAHEDVSSQEILSELPANAPPGECYAKVVVPGQRVEQPPVMQGAVWVVSPGRPGMPGPIWCLVPTGPIAQAAIESPARYGWIRVLCDTDATPERIGHVQHALHDRGYYHGEASGHYDRATVEAVTEFQAGAHINHGGYLSLQTLQALDEQPPAAYPPAYAPAPVVAYGYQSGYQSGYQPGPAYTYGPPVAYPQQAYAPPPPQAYYPPQPYGPPMQAGPCCAQAQAQAQGQISSYGYSAGYGGFGFGSVSTSVVQNGWLTWSGKSAF